MRLLIQVRITDQAPNQEREGGGRGRLGGDMGLGGFGGVWGGGGPEARPMSLKYAWLEIGG